MTCRSLFPSPVALILAAALAFTGTAARARELGWFGDRDAPTVTLLMSQSPTIIDPQGELQPGFQNWLRLMAERGHLRIRARATPTDQPLEAVLRQADTCSIAYARLPAREAQVHWLMEMRRDRMVFIARGQDPFQGNLPAFLRVVSGKLAAPRGIYQTVLEGRGIDHITVDDQRALARMVETGQVRFGMLIGSALDTPDLKDMDIRVVAELPPQGYWFACSLSMPDATVARLTGALALPEIDRARLAAIHGTPPLAAQTD